MFVCKLSIYPESFGDVGDASWQDVFGAKNLQVKLDRLILKMLVGEFFLDNIAQQNISKFMSHLGAIFGVLFEG